MTGFPSASVIIPTRNRNRLLLDCIESLQNQVSVEERCEIIVVDDGASRTTQAAVAELADPLAVSYVRGNGAGLNASRNAGMAAADGDLMVLLDDDVICPPGWLAAFRNAASRYSGPVCFGGPIRVRVEGTLPRMCGRESLGASELDLGEHEKEVDHLFGGNLAITRPAFEMAGPFKESIPGGRNLGGEEMEWEGRLLSGQGKLIYVPDAWIWHRRLQEDLGLTRLLKSRFGRGRSWPMAAHYRRTHTSVAAAGWRFVSGLGHAVRHRCWGGVLQAAEAAGWGIQEIRLLMRSPRQEYLGWWPRRD